MLIYMPLTKWKPQINEIFYRHASFAEIDFIVQVFNSHNYAATFYYDTRDQPGKYSVLFAMTSRLFKEPARAVINAIYAQLKIVILKSFKVSFSGGLMF